MGCMARVLLVIATETLTIAVCVKGFGMSEGSTLCAVFAILCIVLAFAIYYDDAYNGQAQKEKPKHVPQEDINNISHCPYCFSGNTTMDEYGNCLCFDCKTHWREEDAI